MQSQDILDTIHTTSNQGLAVLGAAERFQSLGQNLVMKHENLLLVLRGSLCLEALGQLTSSCLPSRWPWLHEEGKDYEALKRLHKGTENFAIYVHQRVYLKLVDLLESCNLLSISAYFLTFVHIKA